MISFSDMVPGKNVEGGAELIGSNHPTWLAYAKQFNLEMLDVTESDDESPIILNGKRLSSDDSEKMWKDLEAAFGQILTDARTVTDPSEPWRTPNAEALDKRSLASWIDSLSVPALVKSGLHAEFTADNGVETGWQSYLAISR